MGRESSSIETAALESMGRQELRLLLEVSRLFNSSLDMVQTLNTVIDKVIEVLTAQRGCLMMADEDGELRLVVARGMDRNTIQEDEFAMSRHLVEQVAATGKPLLSSNAMQDPRFGEFSSVSMHGIRSTMAAPMVAKGRIIGLIYVDNRIRSGLFKHHNLEFLETIAAQAAVAVDNPRLYEMKKQIIMVLANAIEAKDTYTRGHIERVCASSLAIGRELGVAEEDLEDLEDLEICGFLHDAGKIGVPDHVLMKPGSLDDEERRKMEVHPALGEALVGPVDVPKRIKSSIRQHQERYDGSGYPDSLAGEQIHLFARIIAVADTWDAMTSDRPYRNALDRQEALEELVRNSGTQLDPKIVQAFLQVLERQQTVAAADSEP